MNVDTDVAERVGTLLGFFVACRFLQLLGMDPEKEPALAGLVIQATREMHVAAARAEDPAAAMREVLQLEELAR